jgi:hypothetical protein
MRHSEKVLRYILQILDDLLRTPEYAHLGSVWDEQTREHLNLVWHRLNGARPSPCLFT